VRPASLLGAHVGRRPHRDPRLSQLRHRFIPGRCHRSRDPEIRHARVGARQQDVRRLDVAVHDPVAVGVAQRVSHFAGDLEGVFEGELLLPVEPVPQRLALDVRHDIVEQPVGLAGVEEWKDVRVVEPGGEGDFAEEPLRAERGGDLWLQNLQGDGTIVLQIVGQIDRGHPAPAELPLDRVSRGQRPRQSLKLVGHPLPRRRRMDL
jgi:hypothetical protein